MSPPTPLPSPEFLLRTAKALKAQAKAIAVLAKAVSPPSPDRLGRGLAALEKAGGADVSAVRMEIEAWLAEEKAGRRERLSTALRAGCEAANLELLVLSKAPLELRLPPISARIDLEANRAELLYSQQLLASCEADAAAILTARRGAVAALEGEGWATAAFHTLLHRAWTRAAPGGGWAELVDVLPEVVLLHQPRSFRLDPAPKRFVSYSRAQFAYDLWRLRRDRALSQNGWRLSVAPATGASTKDKKAVFWLEDDRGQGQYHLTLRFVRESEREESHGAP